MDWSKYAPYFSEHEFTCKCGCGVTLMSPSFMDALTELRKDFNKPMVITSGYRCSAHNSEVSTTGGKGPHTTGKAADIAVSGADALRLLVIALGQGDFTGFGLAQRGDHKSRYIHLDTLTNQESGSRPTIWTY